MIINCCLIPIKIKKQKNQTMVDNESTKQSNMQKTQDNNN